MNKIAIISILAGLTIISIVLVVIFLRPSNSAETAVLSQKPVEQKNLLTDVGAIVGGIFGKGL